MTKAMVSKGWNITFKNSTMNNHYDAGSYVALMDFDMLAVMDTFITMYDDAIAYMVKNHYIKPTTNVEMDVMKLAGHVFDTKKGVTALSLN